MVVGAGATAWATGAGVGTGWAAVVGGLVTGTVVVGAAVVGVDGWVTRLSTSAMR